jgi:outer membrane protein TolC
MQQSLYSRSEQELEYQVSRMYFSILARNKIISSLRASRKTLESHYARIKNRVSAGKAPSIDLTRMSVELGSIEQEILKAEGELKLMYLELAYMTGIPYDEKPFTLEDRMEIKEPEREMEMLVSQALEKRPDLMAADYFLQAGEHGIKAAESLSKPQVSLKSSVTYLRNSDGEDDTSGYIGLNVEFPLWDGGLARARMKEAQGERDTAFYKKKDLISRIRLEVESACTELATTFKRVQVTEEALENAREGLRIEMLKHEMNKGTVTDVLQAQSALLAAESDLTLALAENNIAEARLRLTIGVDRS